jgi:hypothetical protein
MAFNTKASQFSWKELLVFIDGRPMFELTDIEWKVAKNLEHIYGAGDKPQAIGEGNKGYTGSVEMLQSGYEAMIEEAKKRGGDDLTDLEVNILVTLTPLKTSALTIALKTTVNRVIGVKFSEDTYKISQGNTHAKIGIPFFALDIEKQI